jgi:hypothetical protein
MSDWNAAEIEKVIRLQTAEIKRQRLQIEAQEAEINVLVSWVMGDGPDALAMLQRTYLDPKTSEGNRLKAAIGAIAYEKSKPPSSNIVSIDIAAQINAGRMRVLRGEVTPDGECPTNNSPGKQWWQAENAAKVIEHQPAQANDNSAPDEPPPPAA